MTRLRPTLLTLLFAAIALPAQAQTSEPLTLDDFKEKSRELAEQARESGEAFVDSEMVANMADLLSTLAERVEFETQDGAGTVLRLDGDEVLRFDLKRERDVDDALTISGLGRNLTVERETVIRDGKTRTRIVIEMDGGEDAVVEAPERGPDRDSSD